MQLKLKFRNAIDGILQMATAQARPQRYYQQRIRAEWLSGSTRVWQVVWRATVSTVADRTSKIGVLIRNSLKKLYFSPRSVLRMQSKVIPIRYVLQVYKRCPRLRTHERRVEIMLRRGHSLWYYTYGRFHLSSTLPSHSENSGLFLLKFKRMIKH